MKHMKKVASLLMAMAMILTMTVISFAANNGSITISSVSEGNIYEIYKLLNLESYDTESGAYSYKVNSAWTAFFATDAAKVYISVAPDGYVAWNADEDDDTVAAFAKLALAYAEEHGISPVQSSKAVTDKPNGDMVLTGTTGVFSNLELGYYLVDSTMGALCGLTTTNPAAYINAKNAAPTIDKQVQEDSTSQWGAYNTADIGQIVNYRVTINVHAGAQNYVLHDAMEDGLTFTHTPGVKLYPDAAADSEEAKMFRGVWKIEHLKPGASGSTVTEVPGEYYTVVHSALDDGCDFEVRFTQAFCDHLETNDKVIVYYNAMLNRHASIAKEKANDADSEGNVNEAWLDYGENHKTTSDAVTTYTYAFDLVKTNSQNKLINGAGFRIYDDANAGNEIKVVKWLETDDTPWDGVTYRRARNDEDGIEIAVTDGKVRLVGFDNGQYYVEETTTPAGYNKLTARQKFTIADKNLDATIIDDVVSTNSGVHVVNKTGTMLPETGGMGTVMFITCGSVLVMAAGVLLVTKKRMSMIED